jgi:hypothetical protein
MKPMPFSVRTFCNYLGLAVAALMLLAGPSLAASNPDGVAVIIGNKNYQGHIPEVTYAHRDADAMRHYIIDVLGYDPDNIIDLRDASKASMEAVFGNSREHKGRIWRYLDPDGNSDVVVFYSGHGVPSLKDQRGYLLPIDADPEAPEINGYPVDLLYQNLSKLTEARSILLMLEACFSGDSHLGALIRAASGIVVAPKMPRQADRLTVLTAARGDQLASWDEKAQHGLFTENFIQAVYGAADFNGDKQITLSEVRDYLSKHVRRTARRNFGREQQPMINGDDRMVLARLNDRTSRPRLDGQTPIEARTNGTAKPKLPKTVALPVPQASTEQQKEALDKLIWNTIRHSELSSDFEEYLEKFPGGIFSNLARREIQRLAGLEVTNDVNNGLWHGFIQVDPASDRYYGPPRCRDGTIGVHLEILDGYVTGYLEARGDAGAPGFDDGRITITGEFIVGASQLLVTGHDDHFFNRLEGNIDAGNWSNDDCAGTYRLTKIRSNIAKKPELSKTVALPVPSASTEQQKEALDKLIWNTIRHSELSSDFEEYLEKFPDGIFSNLARREIQRLAGLEVTNDVNNGLWHGFIQVDPASDRTNYGAPACRDGIVDVHLEILDGHVTGYLQARNATVAPGFDGGRIGITGKFTAATNQLNATGNDDHFFNRLEGSIDTGKWSNDECSGTYWLTKVTVQ